MNELTFNLSWMFGLSGISLLIAILIAFGVALVMWKVFKFALKTAIFVAILIVGLYLASRFFGFDPLNIF